MRQNASPSPQRGLRRLLLCGMAVFAVVLLAALCEELVWPQASGVRTLAKGGTEVDFSHAEQGYVMVRQDAGNTRYKLRMEKDGETYTYDLNSQGAWEVFPLQMGTGSYTVKVFRQASGNKYAPVSSLKFTVDSFADENAPFLCPSQYVSYTQEGAVTALSRELCRDATDTAERVRIIRDWVRTNIQYDYMLALSVESGYLPQLEELLTRRMGICFDYAALTAALLRVQGVPAKLVIGYADKTYHAWNEVLVNGQWIRLDTTAQATNMQVKSYTTERFY